MAPQLSPSVLEQSRQTTSALEDALTARLAAEITLDRSDEAIAAATGGPIAAINALTCGRYRQLDAVQEAQVDRIVWQPIAESCIARMLHFFFDMADRYRGGGQARFVDEDLECIAGAYIRAPVSAKRMGLDDSDRHRVAELTVELFSDRSRFAQPTVLQCDGRTYLVQRSDDELFVLAR